MHVYEKTDSRAGENERHRKRRPPPKRSAPKKWVSKHAAMLPRYFLRIPVPYATDSKKHLRFPARAGFIDPIIARWPVFFKPGAGQD